VCFFGIERINVFTNIGTHFKHGVLRIFVTCKFGDLLLLPVFFLPLDKLLGLRLEASTFPLMCTETSAIFVLLSTARAFDEGH
jgi:hypothetical protein